MKIGFIGVGTIAQAMVHGLFASKLPMESITVSPRSAAVVASLAERYPTLRIAKDNQQVLDAADLLFVAVRPQVVQSVLTPLRFRDGQQVVSLVAATSAQDLRCWIDAEVVLTQAIPLPFVETHQGITAVFPGSAQVMEVFNALGTAVAIQTKEELDLAGVASAMMGPLFGILEETANWLVQHGMPEATTRAYLTPLFQSLAQTAARAPATQYSALRAEYSTKGGINEQLFAEFVQLGGAAAWQAALARVHARIVGGDVPAGEA